MDCKLCPCELCIKREYEYDENYEEYDEDEIVPIDQSVIPIVQYINASNNLEVVGSCGGHKDHKPYQACEGFFYVDFIGDFDTVCDLVYYLSEREGHCLEVVIKCTIFDGFFYRLQGKLETAIDILL